MGVTGLNVELPAEGLRDGAPPFAERAEVVARRERQVPQVLDAELRTERRVPQALGEELRTE